MSEEEEEKKTELLEEKVEAKGAEEEKKERISAKQVKQPRLMPSNRLFGRLAGKTLESLALKPKTSSELKREEVDRKLREKLLSEKQEQEEKLEAERKRSREERAEREEKMKRDFDVKRSLLAKQYELNLGYASKSFKKTKTEPELFWKSADESAMISS